MSDEDTPYHEPTQQACYNPYDIYPYTDLPPVPPPPPKKRRHIVTIATVISVIAILLTLPAYALVTSSMNVRSSPVAHVTVVPTATVTPPPTVTPYPTATPVSTVPYTAYDVLTAFQSNGIIISNIHQDGKYDWSWCCIYIPERGSYSFTSQYGTDGIDIATYINPDEA